MMGTTPTKEVIKKTMDLICQVIKIRESTSIAVDVNFSLSYWHLEFIFYPNANDTSYTHIETISLDSYDASEELDKVYEILGALNINTEQSILFNNQLN